MLQGNLDDAVRLAASPSIPAGDASGPSSFDRTARLAARLLDAPVALVCLGTGTGARLEGATGLEEHGAAVAAMPASVVAPVGAGGGEPLGTLCAFDVRPRSWTQEERQLLADLAATVATELRLGALADEAIAQTEHLAAVGAAALDAIVVMGADGVLLDLNDAAVALFGYPREAAIGTELARLIIPERLRGGHRTALARHRTAGVEREEIIGRRSEFVAMRADGSEMPIELSVTRTEVGGQVRFTGFIRDLSEVRRAERERQAAEARAAMVVDAAPMVLFAFDAAGVVSHCAGTALRALGQDADDLIGRSVLDVYAADHRSLSSFRRVLAGESFSTLREVGKAVFETRYRPLRDASGAVKGAVGVTLDVTERQRIEARVQQLAYTDGLTGLPNRAALSELAATTLEAHRETGEPAALLFVNLDDFRTVNESFGHHTGDQVLRDTAARLQAALGTRGVLSRQGGDEFLIFVADLGACPATAVERIALDAIQALERPLVHEDVEFTVRACIGSSTYPQDGERFEELLHRADLAMYRAKSAGQGRYAAYLHQGSDARHRLTITTRLRRALAQDELELHYQPLVALDTGRPVAVEALLRWNDPVHGQIPPLDFIPAAEATGLIVEVGAWVAEAACRQLAAWSATGLDLTVGINVSPRQFGTGGFPAHLAEVIAATGVDPGHLVVEVTELAAMDGTPETGRDLQRLADMGVHVAVDDFGAGHSSLTRLRELPVTALKLDRALLEGYPGDAAAAAVVGASIALADALGVRTVAEGVEHPEQRDALAALGCALGQGFALAHPMPVAEATAFLLASGCPRRDDGLPAPAPAVLAG